MYRWRFWVRPAGCYGNRAILSSRIFESLTQVECHTHHIFCVSFDCLGGEGRRERSGRKRRREGKEEGVGIGGEGRGGRRGEERREEGRGEERRRGESKEWEGGRERGKEGGRERREGGKRRERGRKGEYRKRG